jgi:F0F1-type ATP synthase assembly protein I
VSKKSNLVLMVMVITAAIVAPLVLGGAYLGYYVGAQVGFSGPIMAIGLSTVGFLVAIFVVIRAITWLVAREQPKS